MFVNQSLPNGYLLKITDFGLAHIFEDQSSFLEKESRGTPFYMASEIRDMTLMSRFLSNKSYDTLLADV